MSKIYHVESVEYAADILRGASADPGVILILGNRVNPIEIPDFISYRSKIQSEERKRIRLPEAQRRYFAYLEHARLVSSNVIPHYNLICILRLIKRGIVKAIITTNYDNFIPSVLLRYGGVYKSILNPCIVNTQKQSADWNYDGYYSDSNVPTNGIPLWKIHGDLGFVRMDQCDHIFALPKFSIEKISRLESIQPCCCHFAVLQEDGNQYSTDVYLAREHIATEYQHHIDYGLDRRFFHRELGTARDQLIEHCEKEGAVFIIGLSFNPRFREELSSILAKVSGNAPLIYIMSSRNKLKASDSDLLFELQKAGRNYTLVNEVNRKGSLDIALIEILERIGEKAIFREYKSWENGGKWWIP